MPDYRPRFAVGTWVRIVSPGDLEAFTRAWYSRPDFSAEQLAYADRVARVTRVACYYAGDALYECPGFRVCGTRRACGQTWSRKGEGLWPSRAFRLP